MSWKALSDHDLHAQGVLLAAQRDGRGKLLHKALDRRHRSVLSRFDRAETIDDVKALWLVALKDGDIPGAYWAAMTHPAATSALSARFSATSTCSPIWSARPIAPTFAG